MPVPRWSWLASDVHVVTPTDAGYDDHRQLFDASLNRYPSLVLVPGSVTSAEALVLSLLAQGDQFTLKAGGHSAAGLSVRDHVTLVDLSRLRRVEVDVGRGLAHLEPGCLMRDLDAATARHGLATTGGTVSHTGVFGLALGGGIGWLMGSMGLTCDNIVGARVVAGSGAVHVLDSDHSDLWALRGAGATLGFASRLTLRLHKAPSGIRRTRIPIELQSLPEAIAIFAGAIPDLADSVGVSLALDWAGDGGVQGEIEVVEASSTYGASTMPPQWSVTWAGAGTTECLPYVDMQQRYDDAFPFGQRSYRRALCLEGLHPAAIATLVEEFAPSSGLRCSLVFDVIHGQASHEPPGGSSFGARDQSLVGVFVCRWETGRHDDSSRRDARRLYRQIARILGAAEHRTYGNYSSEASDSGPYRSAATDLRDIKMRWDPRRVFG